MSWFTLQERKPPYGKMIIVHTDKGIGVGKFGPNDELTEVILDGNTQYSKHDLIKWMPLPEAS